MTEAAESTAVGHLPPGSRPLPLSVPIVIFADAFEIGGTAVYTANVALAARRRGYRVAVICPSPEATPDRPFERQGIESMRSRLHDGGVEVHAIERRLLSPAGRLARIWRLASTIRRYPDPVVLLLMGWFLGGGPVILAGRLAGVRAIVRADLQPPEPPVTRSERLAARLKDRMVARMVVGARENRAAVCELLGIREERIEVINTGIEPGRYVPGAGRLEARASMGLEPGHIAVGVVSRLAEERKGVGDFVRLAAEAAGQDPRLHFVIVGDGYSRQRYEREAAQLGLEGRVTFTGWRPDIVATLAALDVFVMPSRAEGGPTVVVEAMAMQLPVVATRVGMVPEIVTDGETGMICDPGDVPALAAAVLRLARDPARSRAMGVAARARALEDLTLEAMVDRYLDLLRRVHASARRSPRSVD